MNHEIHEAHEKAETLAEIVAEMRRFGQRHWMHDEGQNIRLYADRIEAAAKRERAEIEANALAVGGVVEASRNKPSGDAAAMCEAALPWIAFAEWLLENAGKDALGAAIRDNGPIIRQRLEELRAALSAPPRNCDVGTAKEQAERYGRYCDKFTRDGMHCETCPCCGKIPFGKCEFAWAQMPHEEGANA